MRGCDTSVQSDVGKYDEKDCIGILSISVYFLIVQIGYAGPMELILIDFRKRRGISMAGHGMVHHIDGIRWEGKGHLQNMYEQQHKFY